MSKSKSSRWNQRFKNSIGHDRGGAERLGTSAGVAIVEEYNNQK